MILADRFLFVHVPKTGGQSVTSSLGGKSTRATHTPLRCIDKGDRFAFGFVRNPWARMVSLYRFMCQRPWRPDEGYDQERVRRVGFSAWLTEPEFAFWMGEDDEWMTDDLPPMQRRPQLWWLDGCDYIGRTENLAEDFTRACALADITAPPLRHINRTRGRNYRLEYGDREAEFVAEWFAPDIERFGFAF